MHRARHPYWIGYVAAALLLGHAVLSYYWAAGGTAGLNLLSEGIRDHAETRETWFLAMIWAVAVLKTVVGFIAVALAREVALPVPRWMPLLVTWGAGTVLTLYGLMQIVNLTLGGLILNDGQELPAGFWPYLLLWAPWWLAIGVSYLLLSWAVTRTPFDASKQRSKGELRNI
jgi:hypothetical protein